jgi:hypothetical protein
MSGSSITSIPKIEHVNEVLTTHFGPDFVLVNISAEEVEAEEWPFRQT